MGLGSVLKKAFGAIGEFDRKYTYGADYKDRAAHLARLNDAEIQSKALDTATQRWNLQKQQQQVQRDNLLDALKVGPALMTGAAESNAQVGPQVGVEGPPTMPDSPGLEDLPSDLPGAGGGVPKTENPYPVSENLGMRPSYAMNLPAQQQSGPDVASMFGVDPAMAGDVNSSVKSIARQRQSDQEFDRRYKTATLERQMNPTARDYFLQDRQDARKLISGPGGMGQDATTRYGVVSQLTQDGRVANFDRMGNFVGYATTPEGNPTFRTAPRTTGGNQEAVTGLTTAIRLMESNKDRVLAAMPELGPVIGRMGRFSVKNLGGIGLSPQQLSGVVALMRQTTTEAFSNGGKQLTITELGQFREILNQPEDTPEAALEKWGQADEFLRLKLRERLGNMSEFEQRAMPLGAFELAGVRPRFGGTGQVQPAGGGNAGGPAIGTVGTVNGQPAVWDGHGWVAK